MKQPESKQAESNQPEQQKVAPPLNEDTSGPEDSTTAADPFDRAAALIQKGYTATNPPKKGPITDIIAKILPIFISLLGGCVASKSDEEVISMAKSKSRFATVMVEAEVRSQLRDKYGLGAYAKYDGDRLCKTILNAVAEAKPEEVRDFRAACSA